MDFMTVLPFFVSFVFTIGSFILLWMFLRKQDMHTSQIIVFGILGLAMLVLYTAFRAFGVKIGLENLLVSTFMLLGSGFLFYASYLLWGASKPESVKVSMIKTSTGKMRKTRKKATKAKKPAKKAAKKGKGQKKSVNGRR